MTDKKIDIDQRIIDDWRELGFYYDFDERISVNQWRFYGSKNGLQNFVRILNDYTNDPRNDRLSEHSHFGLYSYLKIMTWNAPVITANYIAGTIQDLKSLGNIIADKISEAERGQTFNIEKDYGIDNTVTAKFFVMSDDFDPGSMDELIVSNRQEIVNNHWKEQKT